jgi:16S rRNA G527 N7-methylase RsmG
LLIIFLGDHINRDHAKVAEELEEAKVEATAATNRAVESLSKVARLRKQYKLINERFKVKMAHESAFLEQEDRKRGVPLSLETVDMSFLEDPMWVAKVMGVNITEGSPGSVGGTF